MKRTIDVVVSFAALVVLLPVLVFIALAVWLDSGRPVFFAQPRVGRGLRPFTMLKFRSMHSQGGPQITSAGDRRITRVGRFLRAAKLDELPQFWNVLRGDMSLVGPRPEVPRYVRLFRPQYEHILRVRPGITDLASISFHHEEDLLASTSDPESMYIGTILPEKLRLSAYYVTNSSLSLDLSILVRTVVATLDLHRRTRSPEG